MSDKIDDSVSYYTLLVNKHAASGHGAAQHRVYSQLVELVRQCSSYEEIQERMKAGGFYESPGQALYMDKLAAHRDAATQLGFAALAQIYQRKYDEVAANAGAAHIPGWEQEAGRELGRISNVVDAFNELMKGYYELCGAFFGAQGGPLTMIRDAVQKMADNGESFEAVVANPYYRNHSPLAEDKYQQALAAIRQFLQQDPDNSALEADFQQRCKALIEGSDKAVLAKARQEYEARQRRSVNMCIAPDEASGAYTYEPFFEGKL